jgi:hypothetical protein
MNTLSFIFDLRDGGFDENAARMQANRSQR